MNAKQMLKLLRLQVAEQAKTKDVEWHCSCLEHAVWLIENWESDEVKEFMGDKWREINLLG